MLENLLYLILFQEHPLLSFLRFQEQQGLLFSHFIFNNRDVIEIPLELGGYPVTLADTAGIRQAAEELKRREKREQLRFKKVFLLL